MGDNRNGQLGKGEETQPSFSGLVAYYPFDGNASDMSGNGYDGTVDGATLGADRQGNASMAYNLDGVDDRIKIGDQALNGQNHFTFSMWLKTVSGDQFLVTAANASRDNEFPFG